MVQKTLVVELAPDRRRGLKERLAAADFDFRPVPHALFSVKGEGVVATLYASGKLVVQGAAPELFVERWIGAVPAPARPGGFEDLEGEALIGSDETGKGDYFGPLVVAAVRLEPDEAGALRGGEIRDSKLLTDDVALRLGAALRARFPHAIARLDPPRYNEIYQRKGQLNAILADLHVEAITKLARPGIRVLVDKFADASLLEKRLAGRDVRLVQRVRAEGATAVAAASIVAREQFLLALAALSDEVGVDLHKGAGDPVDRSAARFVEIHGLAALPRVAKVHFKNTQKIRSPR